MKFVFDAVVVSTQERESKDGKTKYYRINLDQDGEIVTFECTEDVAKKVQKYKPYQFQGIYSKNEYEGRVYSRLSVVDIFPVPAAVSAKG